MRDSVPSSSVCKYIASMEHLAHPYLYIESTDFIIINNSGCVEKAMAR